MQTFAEWLKEQYGINLPKGNINGEWFVENGLPIVVRCSCCGMTMASPSAYVDDDGYTYCADCKGDD